MFRELVGETNASSPNAIVRLKSKWESEYQAWFNGMLAEYRYAYIWVDGVHLGAGVDREKAALLCVVGAREDGVKELPRYGAWLSGEYGDLVRCAEVFEVSRSECAPAGGGRRRSWVVGRAGCGVRGTGHQR